jgi:hypothetical protein
MKNTLMIVLCSVAILISGCAAHDAHSKTVAVASLPGSTSDKILSQVSRVLGSSGISCDISRGAFGSEPARYNISVPADKQAAATSLLKQDAASHSYDIKIY